MNVKVIEKEIVGRHWKARLALALKAHNNARDIQLILYPFINTACDVLTEIITECIYECGLVKELFRNYTQSLD